MCLLLGKISLKALFAIILNVILTFSLPPVFVQALEQRLHSANHSLQATPNSTIHSLVHSVHPPLVDLWNTGQMEAYQVEAGGYQGVAAMVEPSLCVPSGDEMVGNEHSPLLEQQEEEPVKVCTLPRYYYYLKIILKTFIGVLFTHLPVIWLKCLLLMPWITLDNLGDGDIFFICCYYLKKKKLIFYFFFLPNVVLFSVNLTQTSIFSKNCLFSLNIFKICLYEF